MTNGITVSSDGGTPIAVDDVQRQTDAFLPREKSEDEIINPNGEPLIRVRARDGIEFYHEGIKRRGGDVFNMTINQARAAAMYVEAVMSSGKRVAVPHEQQKIDEVPRANTSGLARHERVGALQEERDALARRLTDLDARIKFETDALQREQADAAQKADAQRAKTEPTTERPANDQPDPTDRAIVDIVAAHPAARVDAVGESGTATPPRSPTNRK